MLHFTARDSLRVVAQATRYVRVGDAALGIVDERSDSRIVSLVFQHRIAIGRSLSVGASRQRSEPGAVLRDEVFAKAAFAL